MADNKPNADEVAKQDADKAAAMTAEKAAMDERARQQEIRKALEDAPKVTAKHEAVEGGRYKVGDRFVDANGEPVDGKKGD